MRFLVHTPPPVHNSAGITAMHLLTKLIRERGYETLTYPDDPPRSLGDFTQWIHVLGDLEPHDPVTTPKAVRWLLGRKLYHKFDDIPTWTWSQSLNPGYGQLWLDLIDRDLFDGPNKRTGAALFYNGKGPEWPWTGKVVEVPPPFGSMTTITRHAPKTRADVAEMLRDHATLWTADPYTLLAQEAAFCGLPVLCMSGWVDTPLLPEDYDRLAVRRADQLDRFLSVCSRLFT